MKPEVRLTDIMRRVVARVSAKKLAYLQTIDPTITGVHYQYGHLKDVRERLVAQSQANPMTRRYPLIWLIEDFEVVNSIPGIYGVSKVRIMILHDTQKEYTRQQREDRVFLPILIPIYNEFFVQMSVIGSFMQYGPFSHRRVDRPHWGNPAEWLGFKNYLFDEPLDGIEITELSLQIYLANCVIIA